MAQPQSAFEESLSPRWAHTHRMQNSSSVRELLTVSQSAASLRPRRASTPGELEQGVANVSQATAKDQCHTRFAHSVRMQSSEAIHDALTHGPNKHASRLRRHSSALVLRSRSPSPDTVDNLNYFNGTSPLVGSPRSPRAGKDHLWRELFHDEADEQSSPRLRGEGQSIGQRGRSSAGVPWRHLPQYNRKGVLCSTGDQLAADVSPPGERCASPPMVSEGMKDRLQFAGDEATNGAVGAASPRGGGSQHWKFKPQKKSVVKPGRIKDSCPYSRVDSVPEARAVQNPGLSRRSVLAPQASVARGSIIPTAASPPPGPSPKTQTHRRNLQYTQEMAKIYDEVFSACHGYGAPKRRPKAAPRPPAQPRSLEVGAGNGTASAEWERGPCKQKKRDDAVSIGSVSTVSTARSLLHAPMEEVAA